MSLDRLLCFHDLQLSVVVKKSVQGLKHLRRSKVELIKNDPVSIPDGLHQDTLLKDELPFLVGRGGHIRAQVLLDVSVHVVVDPDDLIVSHVGQVLNCGRLASRGRTLEDDCIVGHCHDRGKSPHKSPECWGQDEITLFEVERLMASSGYDKLLHV